VGRTYARAVWAAVGCGAVLDVSVVVCEWKWTEVYFDAFFEIRQAVAQGGIGDGEKEYQARSGGC